MGKYLQATQKCIQQETVSEGPDVLPALEKKWLLMLKVLQIFITKKVALRRHMDAAPRNMKVCCLDAKG